MKMRPGLISKAQFLQLGIYAFKMLFVIMKGWGFQLSDEDKMALLELCKFSAFFYCKLWFRSPYLVNFPPLYLELHHNLHEYVRYVRYLFCKCFQLMIEGDMESS